MGQDDKTQPTLETLRKAAQTLIDLGWRLTLEEGDMAAELGYQAEGVNDMVYDRSRRLISGMWWWEYAPTLAYALSKVWDRVWDEAGSPLAGPASTPRGAVDLLARCFQRLGIDGSQGSIETFVDEGSGERQWRLYGATYMGYAPDLQGALDHLRVGEVRDAEGSDDENPGAGSE